MIRTQIVQALLSCSILAFAACDEGGPVAPKQETTDPETADPVPAEEEEKKLPSAEELLAAHVEAAGGVAKIEEIKSVYFEGTIDTGAQKLRGTTKLWWKPGRFYLEEQLEGLGQSRAGYDGTTVWSEDPITGLRRLEGKEAEPYIRTSTLFLCHDWKKFFDRAETIGEGELEGRKTFEVKLTSPLGQEMLVSFDAETKLLVMSRFMQITPQGDIPMESFPEDYRPLGGYKIAHTQRSKIKNLLELTQTFEKADLNVEIDDSRFNLPNGLKVVAADPADQAPNTPKE